VKSGKKLFMTLTPNHLEQDRMQRVIVLSSHGCIWCERLKEFLTQHGVGYLELNIDDNETAAEIAASQQFMKMPQVLADGRFIGGHDATISYFNKQQEKHNG
jgi:glutaredoxin